jgi:N-acetylmuramoyl-L-alanine amidase CwlA
MYLYNGSGGRQASWHFTVDDKHCFTGIPVDEIAWQAGDGSGPGNYNGFAAELCVERALIANDSRRAQSQKNAAEILGRVGARLGAPPPVKQHNAFSGKNCPAQMRARGEWNRYVSWWVQFNNAEKAAMAGGVAVGPIESGDIIRALVRLNLRQSAGTSRRCRSKPE